MHSLLCCLQAVQRAQQALQAAESSEQQQQGSMVAHTIALIALLLSARCVRKGRASPARIANTRVTGFGQLC